MSHIDLDDRIVFRHLFCETKVDASIWHEDVFVSVFSRSFNNLRIILSKQNCNVMTSFRSRKMQMIPIPMRLNLKSQARSKLLFIAIENVKRVHKSNSFINFQ